MPSHLSLPNRDFITVRAEHRVERLFDVIGLRPHQVLNDLGGIQDAVVDYVRGSVVLRGSGEAVASGVAYETFSIHGEPVLTPVSTSIRSKPSVPRCV